jgi:hypothetical protein
MLAMVFILPSAFGLLVWRSFRSASARSARGEQIATPGALRWEDEPPPPAPRSDDL